MKKGLSLLLILIAVLLVGCGKKTSIQELNVDDIFTNEGKYFVYFYRDDCPDCEQTKPIIVAYLDLIDDNTTYEGKKTVYAVNLSKEENKFAYRSYKDASFNLGDGQGEDGSFWVNGVTDKDKLHIGATAALISVGVDSNNNRFTTFIASGYESISSYLDTYLK